MVNIIEGEDLIFHIKEYDIILVGTSTMNALGNGFQKKIALNFPYVSDINKSTPFGDPRKLGTVKVIGPQNGNPYFLLCYINKGRYRPDLNPDYLNYDALKDCVDIIEKHFPDAHIATTLIGGSRYDGDGDKDRILEILNNSSLDLTIYDYEQTDFNDDSRNQWNNLLQHIGTPEYMALKKQFFWQRAYGELTPYPEGFDEMSDKDVKKYIKNKKAEQ